MRKTTVITALAALLLAVTLAPAFPALRAQSWLDVAGGADFGQGAGLYDPATSNACAAFLGAYQGTIAAWYYMGARYWTTASGNGDSPIPVGSLGAEPTNCATLVPGNQFVVDTVQLDGGGAFWSINDLGAPTTVASLPGATIWVNYCTVPSSNAGDNGLVVPAVGGAFGQRTLDCGGHAGSHVLFPGCALLPASTGSGGLSLDAPVFLYDGGCNSLDGSPSAGFADFAVQHCVAATVFDLVLGASWSSEDEDSFVVAVGGNLLAWTHDPVAPTPNDYFPNVSNREADQSNC